MNRTHPVIRTVAAACLSIVPMLGLTGCLGGGGDEPPKIERPPTIERPDPKATTRPDPNVRPIAIAEGERVIAQIGQNQEAVKVTQQQLMPVLIESYGLDVLLKLVQLNMAKAQAARENQTISPADVDFERQVTMEMAFPGEEPENYPTLMKQLLQRQHVSELEFDIVLQTNAYLRKLVSGDAQARITDEMVRNEFNANYGEKVRVRHIALNNMQEVSAALARLQNGTPFEVVAREMSKYPTTARLGGALPPFSRMTAGLSKAFVDAAFAIPNEGDWSRDPVNDGNFLHIILLEKRIAPVAVKFDDVKDSVRRGLVQRLEQVAMSNLRNRMAEEARRNLEILEPTLKKQFAEKLQEANPNVPTNNAETNSRLDQVRDRLTRAREAGARAKGTTQPAGDEPTTVPATMP